MWIYIIQVQINETDFSESRMLSKNISGIKNFFSVLVLYSFFWSEFLELE